MNQTKSASHATRPVEDLDTILLKLKDLKNPWSTEKVYPFQFRVVVDNFEDYALIDQDFPVNSAPQVRFKLKNAQPLHSLILSKDYAKISLFNQKNGDSNKFLHYQLEIIPKEQRCALRIGLPCQKLRQKSKEDFVELISHLVRKKSVTMTAAEINSFANCIMEINSDAFAGISSFKDQFEVHTLPDHKPIGGIHYVPSTITLELSRNHAKTFGGFEKMAVAFLKALDSFFTDEAYTVKGTIIGKSGREISKNIRQIPFLTVRIPVIADLFETDLDAVSKYWKKIHGKHKNIEIRNFSWRNAPEELNSNRVLIRQNEKKEALDIAIDFDKRLSKDDLQKLNSAFLMKQEFAN